MARTMVAIEDLIDAHGVADVLDLSHYNTVSVYQRRYPDMPRPAVDLGKGRIKLWLKPEIERWATSPPVASRRRSKRDP
jgi:glutathione-regulated potassium-efflux system ancillary protein KefG